LGEALEKLKTRTSSKSGISQPTPNMPNATLLNEKSFTKMRSTRLLLKRLKSNNANIDARKQDVLPK
jgi:hypothetical protein